MLRHKAHKYYVWKSSLYTGIDWAGMLYLGVGYIDIAMDESSLAQLSLN